MKNRILFVGGSWNLTGGKKSSLVEKFACELPNVKVYNGGNYNDLKSIIKSAVDYNIIIWWANVPNNLPKIRNVKTYNYKAMLITAKRNINNKYSFEDLVQRALAVKANLAVEFTKKGDLYNMLLFDPLGNSWYSGTNIKTCANKMLERLDFIKKITREPTVLSRRKTEYLRKSIGINEQYFLELVKDYATKFTEAIFETKDVKRFLGNASFRCPKGFPSFRYDKYIFVSKRNVSKEYISLDDFVPIYMKNNKIYYCGNNKPSVDTPIQIRLYEKLLNINYMIHSHCYIKGAPYTSCALPCGAVEESQEIYNLIKQYYNNDFSKDFYLINLTGHGSIMMSSTPDKLKNINIIGRKLPEKQ